MTAYLNIRKMSHRSQILFEILLYLATYSVTMSISSTVDERWSQHLADELIDMIVKRLGLIDSKAFAAVCSSWRSVTMASQWLATQFPCILQTLPSAATSCYSLYGPGEDRAINNLKFPKDYDGLAPYCSGCFGSWLIIVEHVPVVPPVAMSYFFNPASGARIALPLHCDPSFFERDDETRPNEKVFIKTVASSDPTDPNCIVAALILHGHRLAFCRPNDASWTLQFEPHTPKEGGYGLTDLHFHEGELYAMVGRMIDAVLKFNPIEVLSQSQCGSDEANAFKGKLIGVYALDMHTSYMHHPSFSLITSVNEMNDPGEQAISIGDVGAKTLIVMSKPTNSMPVTDKLGELGSGNCIYCTGEEKESIGVYNLANETLKYQPTGGLQQT